MMLLIQKGCRNLSKLDECFQSIQIKVKALNMQTMRSNSQIVQGYSSNLNQPIISIKEYLNSVPGRGGGQTPGAETFFCIQTLKIH